MNSIISNQRYFIIEGNIGAGKSTFLKMIKEYLNLQVVLEPHEQWQKVGDEHNLLDLFYKDPKRWAYTFQSYAFVSRIMNQQAHARTNPYMVQLLERSVFSDRYCFAYNAYELGYMNALEWKLYQEWFSWLVDTYMRRPDGFIYLQTKPDICYERLQKRNRDEEATVSREYINRLHEKHERWLIEKKDVAPALMNVPVLVLECDADFENNKAEQEKHVEKVGAFVLSHIPGGPTARPLSAVTQ
jgi:deoxyadenosine/deoxycytidine kinase